jgi:predicted RecB family nuclease
MDSPSVPPGFAFSQTSLQDYNDCPRRFQLRYIDQLHWPAVETESILENERRQREGQHFHRMVQQNLIGLPTEKLSPSGQSLDLSRWWEHYLSTNFNFDGYSLFPELTLAAPVGIHRLLAKYDLIAIKPGEKVLIYDWKTSLKRPKDEWMAARMQTRVYRAMLVHAGAYLNGNNPFPPEQIEMIYWYAEYPIEPAHFPYNSTQYKRDWDALTGLITEISNHRHFPLTDDEKKCAYCPYRSYCNRGLKAGTMDEMAESEESLIDINFEQIAEIEY